MSKGKGHSMSDQVGLIGVGAMGRALLSRLRGAGKEVRAYDVAEAARTAAKDGGATVVKTPAEAARGAAFIHVIVASDEQVMETAMGPEGFLTTAPAGSTVLLHSTILPTTTKEIAAAGAKSKIEVIDAPITAVPPRLKEGHGVFLVGGSDKQVAAVRDHLLSIGKDVQHFGPLGAGNVAKLAKALINAGERVLLNEVLDLAASGELNLEQFLEMEKATGNEGPVMRWERIYAIENGRARHRPATNLFNKDIKLAAELAKTYKLDAPMTQGAARTSARWVQEWEKLPKE
jgi:3-hydroxyisobutyrate dehydrogenase